MRALVYLLLCALWTLVVVGGYAIAIVLMYRLGVFLLGLCN